MSMRGSALPHVILSTMARDFIQSSSQFLASIDAEIERLQTLRQQIAVAVDADRAINKPAKAARRGMSEESRRKIAAAQRARWAKQKKANKADTGTPVKKAIAKKTSAKNPAKKGREQAPAKKSVVAKAIERA